MMGTQTAAARFFYDFCLDDHVPQDHQLRGIDRHLDLEGVRAALKLFYSSTGRPSVDPELMIRMLLVGYCLGIRSERRLCEEVHLDLAYRWFCRLGLDGKVPDHSTFSKNRHGRFRESDILRQLSESIVGRCMAEGLVSANGFAVDASLIAADANKQRSVPSSDWNPDEIKDDACRAAREYLATLKDCAVCELKARCCPNAVAQKIPRDVEEDSRDVARALAGTPEFETACQRRKKVEMLFAHLKRILRLGRLRLRGPCGAKDEFLLAATAQNLRRLVRLRPAQVEMAA